MPGFAPREQLVRLCVLPTVLGILVLSGCRSARPPHAGTVFSPHESLEGTAVLRIAGESVRPDRYAIFLPEEPSRTERTAAGELQWHLRLITGQEFAVASEARAGDRHGFFVGACDRYALRGEQMRSLGTDGLIIRTHGPDVQLTGNKRGVLYAVSVFLEDYLDCRWFAPDCMRVPTSGVISVPPIDRRYVPALRNRATDYPEHREGAFAMRSRFTSGNARLDEAHGGKVSWSGVHTFHSLVPPREYLEEHPEYFALLDGERVPAQLCLTNPEVLEIAKKRVRQWIEERPEAQFISVSQNDNRVYCHCRRCAALAEEEGSQAGPLLHFVNAIADDIREEHPDTTISTLAYLYTQTPPKHVRPARNVTIRLCSIDACFSHPLASCSSEENRRFMADLKSWSEVCDQLSIWDYVICYGHTLAPFPNLWVLKPNINAFVEHGAISVYEEANYFSRGGEMAALRTYVLAKTLWDPAYDTDRAIDEFVAAYYGAAACHVRDYIDLLHRSFLNGEGPHVHIWGNDPDHYLPGEFPAQAQALFAKARAAVRDDPVRLRRVQMAQIPALYVALRHQPFYERHAQTLVRTEAPSGLDMESEFWRVVEREQITHYREGTPIEGLREKLHGGPSVLTVERLEDAHVIVECAPGYGGRILALRNRHTGRNWLKLYREHGAIRLPESGSELYSGREFRSPGWEAPFQVVRRTADSIAMRTRLPNGLELRREVSVSGPNVWMRDSLVNQGDGPQDAMLRIHPALAVPHPEATRLLVRTETGEDRLVELPKPDGTAHTTAQHYFRGEERPAGQWGVVDRASGEKLLHRVLGGEIGEYYVHMDWDDLRLTLELWSPARTLAPGQEITIEHEYTLQ